MYRDDEVYQQLEKIITNAGVKITYVKVHDDSIDGAIWARADTESQQILMPDTDEFPNEMIACLVLGHEMGHILSGLGSPDDPVERRYNEAECDQIGVYLYKLAEMTADYEAEKIFLEGAEDGN